MKLISDLEPIRVFRYFEEISKIPHGSGNMSAISKFLDDFATNHSLKFIHDDADNVIIYKNASTGYEDCEPVILQGHIDMVCQKDEDSKIDFDKDSLMLYIDDNFLKAKGTTLGADNGIAVAMILAILEDNSLSHPPIEAVFTTDEEIGMIGAGKLDFSKLSGKKMINIDNEEMDTLVVSCAGGSDFIFNFPFSGVKSEGTKITLTIKGLKGGHSGIEINSGRCNANILLGRVLNKLKRSCDFELINVNGGTKGNAIPLSSEAVLVTKNPDMLIEEAQKCLDVIKSEISDREAGFIFDINKENSGTFETINSDIADKLIFLLFCAPNGVIEMSSQIENLVETSLNLGILVTENKNVKLHFTLRSNKKSALCALEDRLITFAAQLNCSIETFGHYPPWEFKSDSELQKLYIDVYKSKFAKEPKVLAIHAGLECGVFSDNISGIDCISIGPDMFDVHTTKERLDINSTKQVFELIISLLEKCI